MRVQENFLSAALLLLLVFQLAFPSPSKAQDAGAASKKLGEVLILYKKGSYLQATKELKNLESIERLRPTVHYWLGLCYNKIQDFATAAEHFKKAIAAGATARDIYYEYGQALYALNELKTARKAFARSVKAGHMVPSSLYYMGFIGQTLEEYHLALKYYKKISDSSDHVDVSQAAGMQIAEIILIQAKSGKNPGPVVRDYVIPQFQIAYNMDDKSPLAPDITKRMNEVREEYDLDDGKMINGRRIPLKRENLKFQETVSYDSNVITEADEATVKATPENKESAISKTQLSYNYTFLFQRRFHIIPELKFNYDYHFRREAPEIYKNDSYYITPKVEFKAEHFIKKHMATLFVETEYIYTERDVRQNKSMGFYGRTLNLTMGEKIKYFSAGDTTIKYKRKQFEGTTDTVDSHTDTFSLSQTQAFPNHHLLLLLLTLDFNRVPKDDVSSSNSYIIRGDYIIPDFFWGTRPTVAFSLTFLDTLKQQSTRGTEKTYAPSLSLAKTIDQNVDITLKYDYTKNDSDATTTNAYTKHVYGLELSAKF